MVCDIRIRHSAIVEVLQRSLVLTHVHFGIRRDVHADLAHRLELAEDVRHDALLENVASGRDLGSILANFSKYPEIA